MLSHDLLKVAEDLLQTANRGRGRPKQAHLRRAVSSVYYALFHYLMQQCADNFIGAVKSQRSQPAWQQVYRSLDHKTALQACKLCQKQPYNQKFPQAFQEYAQLFSDMQGKRHSADYDPLQIFSKADVLDMLESAKEAIDNTQNTDTKHRKAFSAFVLFGNPR